MGLTLNEAVEKMRGEIGSSIRITVIRGNQDPFDVTLKRAVIAVKSVRWELEQGNIGYVRISSFSEKTDSGLREAIAKLKEATKGQMQGLVLDLRNNPGGLLDQAIAVSDDFMDKGEIVSTRGRKSEEAQRWNAESGDLMDGKPIVILINGGSASASEIVTGALQDHRRAIVVGTKSFGKGSVQTLIPLKGDGAMRLTTARYYTPSGRSIQALGISPDIVVQQPVKPPVDPNAPVEPTAAERRTQSEADLRGAITNDSMTEDEKALYLEEQTKAVEAAKLRDEDYQLAYAVDILKGLTTIGQSTP
jgi:carboxyl-terminal processing protease